MAGIETLHRGGLPCPATERRYFRCHPKGEGVVLLRGGGLQQGAFVGEYVGQLYTAWRWQERGSMPRPPGPDGKRPRGRPKGSGLKKILGATPEFYHSVLERPAADAAGYDVLVVNVREEEAGRGLAGRAGLLCLRLLAAPSADCCGALPGGCLPSSCLCRPCRPPPPPVLIHRLPRTATSPAG